MKRAAWAIGQLREAQRDMMAVIATVEVELQNCQNRIQSIIDDLRAEQPEYETEKKGTAGEDIPF